MITATNETSSWTKKNWNGFGTAKLMIINVIICTIMEILASKNVIRSIAIIATGIRKMKFGANLSNKNDGTMITSINNNIKLI